MAPKKGEREWLTRKARIDPRLDDAGWTKPRGSATPLRGAYRTEEHETANGPADYALWLDRELIGILEAKRVTTNPQEVLSQAERYARGLLDVNEQPIGAVMHHQHCGPGSRLDIPSSERVRCPPWRTSSRSASSR